MKFLLALSTAFALSTLSVAAQSTDKNKDVVVLSDSTYLPADTLTTSEKKRNIFTRFVDYFRNANKPKPTKKVDFGVLPGPHYSATTGFGVGILGTATYSADRSDPALPRSNASIYTDMTTGGFFLLGLRGNHIFPKERYRLDYKVNASTFSANFYGIGFAKNDLDENRANYRRNRITAMGRFMFRLAPKTYLGPLVNYRLYQAKGVQEAERPLWEDQPLTVSALSAGLSFTYDSRDFMLNAKKGVFVQFDQTFNPRFLGNGNYSFSSTELTLCGYQRLWKGAVLAGELHGLFNYGNTPWPVLAELGSNERMRGYYEGRYRDKNLIEGQVELRQHIKGRNGIVLWAGLGNVFPRLEDLAWRKTLTNFGVGYRWEFKKGINVRIDYGFTRNGGGFIFAINEAF